MVITLLSDFGYEDNFVGISKGIILKRLPHAQIVDISHEIVPFHLLQCSYLLKSSYSFFPENTIHLSLFDVMHRNPADLLVLKKNDQYILSSDNGLIPITFNEEYEQVFVKRIAASSYINWMEEVVSFIKKLSDDQFVMPNLEFIEPQMGNLNLKPHYMEDRLECQIIHIDRFGNVVLNIQEDEFEHIRKGRRFEINFSRNEQITKMHHDYSEVGEGEKLCRFNSGRFLELAINKGSAAQLFGFFNHTNRQLIYQKISIRFYDHQDS